MIGRSLASIFLLQLFLTVHQVSAYYLGGGIGVHYDSKCDK